MSRRLTAVGTLVLAAALVLPATASAHGLVGKQDLPIPRWLFAWGAALVLVISFVGLATLWPKPRLEEVREKRVFRLPVQLEAVAGLIGIAVFVLVVYAGFAGVQTPTANLTPTVVYVLFWVGLPVLSCIFGDVFRSFNPWLAIGRGTGWAQRPSRSRTRPGSAVGRRCSGSWRSRGSSWCCRRTSVPIRARCRS